MSKAEDRYLDLFLDGRLRNCSRKDAFLLGYHRAEKDLTDISWIKEVSGVKELSRAKEEALKAYPPISIAANYDTISRRDAFEYGYLKAEKDLELSWEDVSKIISIDQQVCGTMGISNYTHNHQQAMEEVLKRFKNLKK